MKASIYYRTSELVTSADVKNITGDRWDQVLLDSLKWIKEMQADHKKFEVFQFHLAPQ